MAENENHPDPAEAAAEAAEKGGEQKPESIRSLEDLKGKSLADVSFDTLQELFKTEAESVADQRVTAARKKWEKEQEKAVERGDLVTQEKLNKLLEERERRAERKAEARGRLLETLAEVGIKPGTEKYKKFTAAFAEGQKSDEWTAEILTSRGGIRTVLAAAELLPGSAAERDNEEPKPLPRIPDQGLALKGGDNTEKSADEVRLEKMRAAEAALVAEARKMG